MPIKKDDTALKRGQTRDSTAILTSSSYFKELKDESNPTLDSNRDLFLRRDSCLENVERNQRRG
jgi:hypothetical protein